MVYGKDTSDREFMMWIHERLEMVYGDNPREDHMKRLRRVIVSIPEGLEESDNFDAPATLAILKEYLNFKQPPQK